MDEAVSLFRQGVFIIHFYLDGVNWRDKLIYKAPSNPDSKAVFGWLGIKAVFADPAGEVEKGSYGFHFAMWLFGIYACK